MTASTAGPRALFFDLDNTLIDDDACMRLAVSAACRDLRYLLPRTDLEGLAATYVQLSDDYWSRQPYVVGSLMAEARLLLWRQALARHDCDDPATALAARDAYARRRLDICHVYPDTLHALRSFHGLLPLALITNGDGDTQRTRLRLAGLESYFDLVVASTDIDCGKPDPAIFRFALDKLGLDAAAVWHVGDRLDADVLGARNAGLTSVWLNRGGNPRALHEPEPHHEIASLRELPAVLGLGPAPPLQSEDQPLS